MCIFVLVLVVVLAFCGVFSGSSSSGATIYVAPAAKTAPVKPLVPTVTTKEAKATSTIEMTESTKAHRLFDKI